MFAAVLGLAAVACSSPEKMAEMAENVIVKCEPAVLEVVGGVIDAEVSVTYPADYFHPKAILEVTPVIVYEGGEAKMEPFMFQGEKVQDNYQVVPAEGATVTKPVSFEYVPGMEKCYLELRGVVKYKAKSADLPSKKVADGANTTYMLVCQKGKVDYKADGYQEIIKQTAEGQILYNINSADVRNSQLKSQSIKDFQAALDEIKANERKTLTGTDIVAYASPDGKEADNAKLSNKRSASAEKAFKQVTKKHEVAGDVNVTSVAEDWEGFKELVSKSNLPDKELILRLLSMYNDPEVREREIKNISAVYGELAEEILPQLRRARLTLNYQLIGRSDEEILAAVKEDASVLSVEELLYAATLVETAKEKAAIYNTTAKLFPNDYRAYNNLAELSMNAGDYAAAKNFLEKAAKLNAAAAEVNTNLGMIALIDGNVADAENYLVKGTDAKANEAALGNLYVAQGQYERAVSAFGETKSNAAALAQIMAEDYTAAKSTLAGVETPDAYTYYLNAIVGARTNNAAMVAENLVKAIRLDSSLREKALNDAEFRKYAASLLNL